ncbi:MAG TPA: PQQ-binding-like beta-propeller repeat protein [Pirellulales bacterium]|nr:PQQ-binding-like beta-propeller repeat protein [Pirellulales bacterium]
MLADTWPVFRGDAQADGVSQGELPEKPEVVWKRTIKGAQFESTPAIVEGVVYIGAYDGYFRAMNLSDGADRWTFKSELGFKAPAAVRDGRVIVSDVDGRIACLDAADGKEIWHYETAGEINAGANFYKSNVLVGSQDGTLYCLRADTGVEVWKFTIDNMIQCSPTIAGNRVFLAGCDGKLHVVDLDTGEVANAVEINDPTGATAAADGDCVYFGTQGGSVLAVDWKQGKILWSYEPRRKQPFQSSAALTDGLAILGGRDRQIHAIDMKSGVARWIVPTKQKIDSSPVVVGNRAFVACGDGRVVALAVGTGDAVWEYEAGGGFSGSPAVAEGCLVIGNEDDTLYCFGKK